MTKLEEAQTFADDFLFPTANDVDALDVLPRERLDRLAADGWYGLASPTMGLQMADAWPILAAFAGGCLTTTLVWLQHHGNLAACAFGPEHVQHWAVPMASGDIRSSVAFNGLLPNPKLRSRPDGDSWVIDGTAPWMSGWGLVDVIHCATRAPDDDVVWLLIDADDPGLRAEPHRLLGLNASATVTLHFDGVRVEADRLTSRFPWAEWPARDAMGLRGNGSVSVGVAERCARLIGSEGLQADVLAATAALDAADAETGSSRPGSRVVAGRPSGLGADRRRGKRRRGAGDARRAAVPGGGDAPGVRRPAHDPGPAPQRVRGHLRRVCPGPWRIHDWKTMPSAWSCSSPS